MVNVLHEMAYSRTDAMEKCESMGKLFVEHFNKVCSEGIDNESFSHHCVEMQAWFDTVKSYKLKHNNKPLTNVNLIDWFFTCGQSIEDLVNEDYVELYDTLISYLIYDKNSSIKEILCSLMK